MTNKRDQFLKSFMINVEGVKAEHLKTFVKQMKEVRDKKFKEENERMKPTVGEMADGYKGFINDLGGAFLDFAEVYNQCVQVAKRNKVIRDAGMKVRIKDFSSSYKNTDSKLLDDVFGVQLVTGPVVKADKDGKIERFAGTVKEEAEAEKEFLILFNSLIMDIQNHKKYNKNNGYEAYHCTGEFNLNANNLEQHVKEMLENMLVREYKYSKHEPQYEKDKMTKLFPILSEKLKDPRKLKLVIKTLKKMLELMQIAELKEKAIPLIEFHFMTSDVEEISVNGSASHSRYKNDKNKIIKQFFNDGRLFRGINSPWKFVADENGLHLQDFYETLTENWPFLKRDIGNRKKKGKEKVDIERNSKFDRLLASQFPFLRKYIGTKDLQYPERYQQEKWGLLKGILVANRIDPKREFEQNLGKTVLEAMEEIW